MMSDSVSADAPVPECHGEGRSGMLRYARLRIRNLEERAATLEREQIEMRAAWAKKWVDEAVRVARLEEALRFEALSDCACHCCSQRVARAEAALASIKEGE